MTTPSPIECLFDEIQCIEYKTIDTTTRRGLNRANRLLSKGWRPCFLGTHLVQLYRLRSTAIRNSG